ncbi:MerR family transcriptional regulator [Actinomyces viscosus]|uniref:MerR family transcriptional regulator n=1 Tax=Actinomyces viscosus TaxID=1656 RepID=UPI0028E27C3A|nr:MerR family transcriptional regulator [Actinomyces viscosus]
MLTIQWVSQETGLSAPTIRFYEKEGLVKISRNEKGVRVFDDVSLDTLRAVSHYRRAGMSLENIRHVMREFHNHELSTGLLRETKKEIELQIAELEETRRYLEEKIVIHQKLAEMQTRGCSEEERLRAYRTMRKEGNTNV